MYAAIIAILAAILYLLKADPKSYEDDWTCKHCGCTDNAWDADYCGLCGCAQHLDEKGKKMC
jgi:hypothetical protein